MKNFRLHRKRLTALLLSGNLFLLSGCGTVENKEDGKIINSSNLSSTLVVTRFDDTSNTVDIAKKVYIHDSIFDLQHEHEGHDHYKSLLTDELYSTKECDIDSANYTIFPIASAGTMSHYDQLHSENITTYLSEEEKVRVKNNEFTKSDEDNVLKRVMESSKELTSHTEETIAESIEESTQNATNEIESEESSIYENTKTYDLKELYISETCSPSNDVPMMYIFLQMDHNSEYYREYHDKFYTVSKDANSISWAYENNFEGWNKEFVISDSIEPLSMYLTEEDMTCIENGNLTEDQLDGILYRIRQEHNQLSRNSDSKELVK